MTVDRRCNLAHVGSDVKAKPPQGGGSATGLDDVWQQHPLRNMPACQRASNARRCRARPSPRLATGARAMTRVYPLVTIGVLSSDNAAAQLKRLAEQCGVSDADLAAIPDRSADRRSARPLGDLARKATNPAHRSGNHAGRNARGIRAAHSHNRDEHTGHLCARPVGAPEPEKVARRRRWAASGWLPPQISAKFSTGELAVLSVISKQHMEHGRCALCIGAIAARAGVGRTTVQNALRVARRLGLASVQERRYRGRKSETNVVAIVSKEWTSWLARRARSAKARDGAHSIQKPEPIESTSKKEGGFSR
jgi:hypothetical protein